MTPTPSERILERSHLQSFRHRATADGQRIVWTNGCFDILHIGHLTSLEAAKALGDILVVGINADSSVRALKGPPRPINPETDRARLVAALRPVDYVVLFEETSPAPLIAELQPDIYAKGSDYSLQTINPAERAAVEGYGGRIMFLPLIDGKSTSATIQALEPSSQG